MDWQIGLDSRRRPMEFAEQKNRRVDEEGSRINGEA